MAEFPLDPLRPSLRRSISRRWVAALGSGRDSVAISVRLPCVFSLYRPSSPRVQGSGDELTSFALDPAPYGRGVWVSKAQECARC